MNEQNISFLKTSLQTIGFEDGLEYELRSHICFLQPGFYIREKVVKEKDLIFFQFHFELQKETSEYKCSYYDVTLRKEMIIPDRVIGEISSKDLDQRMGEVNWLERKREDKYTLFQKGEYNWKSEITIEEIITALTEMEKVEGGKAIADALKMKYWVDTPLEKMIEGISGLKNQWEISQRFYFFLSGDNITIEEAYRFLNNKWIEKRIQATRKMNDGSTKGNNNTSNSKKGENNNSGKKGSGKGIRIKK